MVMGDELALGQGVVVRRVCVCVCVCQLERGEEGVPVTLAPCLGHLGASRHGQPGPRRRTGLTDHNVTRLLS